ncbi:MAG: LacI family DNA-binding transcriptional regulator [Chloroflexota bacterium]|nr:LacI family DNA-binding transcriptional regulator [Chloroflexota bacterium]
MPPRLKDIAAELGLSVTTVSRALAGYDDVSERTRQRVRGVAETMGYVPDITAQRLRQQRTNVIGFILPTLGPRFSDPFFSELLAGIGDEAGRRGYDLLISTAAPGPAEIDLYRRKVLSRRADGIIVVRIRREDARIKFLLEHDMPFVAFGHTEKDLGFPWVDVDGAKGVAMAVEHLVNLGHSDIAYFGAPSSLMFGYLRLRAFRQALENYGLVASDEWLLTGDLTQRSGHQLGQHVLDMPRRPTAIIAANDLMALGAMAAAQQRGLQVGSDLSIVGFDDIPPAEHAHPSLTTVHQPIYQIATRITAMLIQILNGEDLEERQVLLAPKFVIRQSTGSMVPAFA